MEVFKLLMTNTIYLTFPIVLYLLYQVYSKTLSKEKNDLYLDIALISSFYLITQYGFFNQHFISSLLLNIPLFISYIKDRKVSAVFLSIMTVIYYNSELDISFIFLIVEYILYFIIFLFILNKDNWKIKVVNVLLIIKSICFIITIINFDLSTYAQVFSILGSVLIFYLETFVCVHLLKKSEDVLKLYKTIQELQDEKQVRESLFKITHEIKNPIAVCKGYLDMFDTNNLEHSRKYVPIIKGEIERVLILLKDFLSLTKIKVEADIIDIKMLLDDVTESFLPLIKNRKIKIKSDYDDEDIYILADYNRLSQVFVNLIKNSIEAMEDIKNGKIIISIIENKNSVIIKVSDNGSGISPENIKRMNEPFFTTKSNGTGLGVYLSTEIIKAHNGTICYESDKKGTTVTVTLPNKKGY